MGRKKYILYDNNQLLLYLEKTILYLYGMYNDLIEGEIDYTTFNNYLTIETWAKSKTCTFYYLLLKLNFNCFGCNRLTTFVFEIA